MINLLSIEEHILKISSDILKTRLQNHQFGQKIPVGKANGKSNMSSVLQAVLHRDSDEILAGAIEAKDKYFEFTVEDLGHRLELSFPVLRNISAREATDMFAKHVVKFRSTLEIKLNRKADQGGGPSANAYYVKAADPNRNSAQYAVNAVADSEYSQQLVDYALAHRFVIQGTGTKKIVPKKKKSA